MKQINYFNFRKHFGFIVNIFTIFMIILLFASCQPKIFKLGILVGNGVVDNTEIFRKKMTELGYIQDKNITYDIVLVNYDTEGYKTALKKFVTEKVDLILCYPTQAAVTAKEVLQGTKIPVVFAMADIDGTKIVNSVKEPGGNMTGVRIPGIEMTMKRFEILHQIVPNAKRFWITYRKNYPSNEPILNSLRPAVAAIGGTLIEVPAASKADIQADIDIRAKNKDPGIDAILIIADPFSGNVDNFTIYGKFAAAHKIPIGGINISIDDVASIFSIHFDMNLLYILAAEQVDRILKGADPGTLPVITPDLVLIINYKEAQKLGITIPIALLNSASQIIK